MKKITFFTLALGLMIGCKPALDKQNDESTQNLLKGTWTITKVEHPSSFSISPFFMTDSECFEGSEWSFVPNNNTGTMRMSAHGICPEHSANFIWNIKKNGNFSIKFADKKNAKSVKEGFVLHTKQVSKDSFILIDESTEVTITYYFKKK